PTPACCNTVAAAIHVSSEYMHIFHVAQFRLERKRRTIILWHWSLARCPSVVQECEGRARFFLAPGFTGGLPANLSGISIRAFVTNTATGLRSLPCASRPSRCASSRIDPPPQNGSSTGGAM